MFSIRFLIVFGVLVSGMVSVAPAAFAQATTATPAKNFQANIAVLDIVGIQRNSLAFNDIHEQIAALQKDFGESYQKKDKELGLVRQNLNKKRAILAPEAFADENRKYEQAVIVAQRFFQERNQAIDKARVGAMLKVDKVLKDIIREVAAANNVNLVFRREQTVLSNESMDISKPVLEQLNKRLPKVKVEKPGK